MPSKKKNHQKRQPKQASPNIIETTTPPPAINDTNEYPPLASESHPDTNDENMRVVDGHPKREKDTLKPTGGDVTKDGQKDDQDEHTHDDQNGVRVLRLSSTFSPNQLAKVHDLTEGHDEESLDLTKPHDGHESTKIDVETRDENGSSEANETCELTNDDESGSRDLLDDDSQSDHHNHDHRDQEEHPNPEGNHHPRPAHDDQAHGDSNDDQDQGDEHQTFTTPEPSHDQTHRDRSSHATQIETLSESGERSLTSEPPVTVTEPRNEGSSPPTSQDSTMATVDKNTRPPSENPPFVFRPMNDEDEDPKRALLFPQETRPRGPKSSATLGIRHTMRCRRRSTYTPSQLTISNSESLTDDEDDETHPAHPPTTLEIYLSYFDINADGKLDVDDSFRAIKNLGFNSLYAYGICLVFHLLICRWLGLIEDRKSVRGKWKIDFESDRRGPDLIDSLVWERYPMEIEEKRIGPFQILFRVAKMVIDGKKIQDSMGLIKLVLGWMIVISLTWTPSLSVDRELIEGVYDGNLFYLIDASHKRIV